MGSMLPLLTLMSLLLTLTPMLLLMTTPNPTSTLLRLVMVLVTLLDLTLLLFLMAVPNMSTTGLMDMKNMLLMLPMMALLSTQISHLSTPPLSPMLDTMDKGCRRNRQNTDPKNKMTSSTTPQLKTDQDLVSLFIHIY